MSEREPERQALTKEVRRELARIEQALQAMPHLTWFERAALVRDANRTLRDAFNLGPRKDLHLAAASLFHEVHRAVYPSEVGDEFEHTRLDNPTSLELAFQFLEADPWFFRSGYVKAALLRKIGRLELPPEYEPRLQQIVLAAVDAGDRREFRRYCWAARRIDNSSLRDELAQRVAGTNTGAKRRAQWMLDVLNSR